VSILVGVCTAAAVVIRNVKSLTADRGGLSQRYSNKWLYIIAVFIFEVGSAISGAAPTMPVLVFSRVLAGIGGSGIYVGTVNIITFMTTAVERSQYLSHVGMAWSLGTM
jgi:MFS family permease